MVATMLKPCVLVCLISLLASACGGKVTVDSAASDLGVGGSGGGSVVPQVVPCPGAPGTQLSNDQILPLVGQPCAPNAECDNNNGCGGCFVSCVNGVWAASYPDQGVCWSLDNC
jgi:hypothetical protein